MSCPNHPPAKVTIVKTHDDKLVFRVDLGPKLTVEEAKAIKPLIEYGVHQAASLGALFGDLYKRMMGKS